MTSFAADFKDYEELRPEVQNLIFPCSDKSDL